MFWSLIMHAQCLIGDPSSVGGGFKTSLKLIPIKLGDFCIKPTSLHAAGGPFIHLCVGGLGNEERESGNKEFPGDILGGK